MEVNSNDKAQDVAKRTAQLLSTQGWCLWRCAALGGDIIVVTKSNNGLTEEQERQAMNAMSKVADTIKPDTFSFTEYSIDELQNLLEGDEPTIRLVHEAKKQGAVIE